jgi:NAD(P)-dependent dehydrogenase (short-subunit alcohol dehydrogenase family)
MGNMTYDFSNRVAMITGASGNLGTALTRAYQASGAKLVIVDRKKDVLERLFPDLANNEDCYISGCADLTDLDEVSSVVQDTFDHFGRIDILANTVGGYRAGTPIYETDLDTWNFMINLNARSVFILTRSVLPYMIQQGSGKIVHLAARPGLQGRANASAYSASKSAVIRLTESASAEVKEMGINVNCILPGTLDTPENRVARPDADFSHWVKLESLANVILFLTSDAARDIHGAAIPVYGLS